MKSRLLAQISEFEAQTFAAGQLARRLAAEHRDIPTCEMTIRPGLCNGHHVMLSIWPQTPDALRTWAEVLGCTVTGEVGPRPYEVGTEEVRLDAQMVVGAVEVRVWFISTDEQEFARYRQAEGGGPE